MDNTNSKQILIAGATGLIGSELTLMLTNLGYHVMVLTRNPGKIKSGIPKNVGFIEWNGGFTNWLVREVEKSFAIINLAGEGIADKKWTSRRKMQLVRSRLGTTRALAKACSFANSKPSVFIQASAIGYYPNSNEIVCDEESAPGTGFLSRLSVDWETVAFHEIPKDIRLIILRTGVVLSRSGGMLYQLLKPFKFYVGAWFGNGRQIVSWVHIHDQVNAILFLLNNPEAKGPFNIVSPDPVNLKTLVKRVAKNLHLIAWMSIPSFVVKLIFGEMGTTVLLNGQKVYPKKLIDLGYKFSFPTIGEAIDNLVKKTKFNGI